MLALESMTHWMGSLGTLRGNGEPAATSDETACAGVADARPLCVDLDGTLTPSNTLWESVASLLRRPSARAIGVVLRGALRGRNGLKRALAEVGAFNPALLPFNQDVLDLVRDARASGRTIVLVTEADQIVAKRVADQLGGGFDHVIASERGANLDGMAKRDALVAQYGERGFDYVGDSRADVPVWKAAMQAIRVAPASSPRNMYGIQFARTLASSRSCWAMFEALRPYQWAKNVLLAVPLIFAHQWAAPHKVILALLGMIVFSACASSVYLVNDILDLPSDRLHPTKRRRPFASGRASIAGGLLTAVGLLTSSVVGAAFLSTSFVLCLVLYVLAANAYSMYLRRRVLIDVLVLSGLYTLRILAGGALMQIQVSPWLMGFSIFFFCSLAFAKRYAELALLPQENRLKREGRGYSVADVDTIAMMGIGSGLGSVVIFCLYISESMAATRQYPHRELLWLLAPLLLYWILRLWFVARRKGLNEDPLIYAMRSPVSLITILLGIVVFVLAATRWPGE